MKRLLYLLCSIVFMHALAINSMELAELSVVSSGCNYKDKLAKARMEFEQLSAIGCQQEYAHMDVHQTYYAMLENIVYNSSDMPPQEKLEYLCGDQRYKKRKEIIVSLVESGLNPNHIAYQGTTALAESIEKKDVDLVGFLLKAGVRPFKKDRRQARQSSCDAIKTLFDYYQPDASILEYCGMLVRKNNVGDIFPLWQDIPPTQLKNKLIAFISSCMREMPGKACIIEVPHDQSYVLDILRQTPFILHHTDSMKTEWIYKDESMSAPFSAIINYWCPDGCYYLR